LQKDSSSFQENQLHLLVEDLKDCSLDCSRLKSKKQLRSILKCIGIGFLLFRNIDNQIVENQTKKGALLKSAYPISNAYLLYLKEQLNKIEKANQFLSKDEEANWSASIESSKADINYLLSFPNQQPLYDTGIISQLDNGKQFITSFNSNLEKAQLRNRLLELKNEIIKGKQNYDELYQRPMYFAKSELHQWQSTFSSLRDLIKTALNKGIIGLNFQDSLNQLRDIFENGEKLLKERNQHFIETEIREEKLFPPVEGQTLTEEQKRAIVVDEANTLVVAGAGTGKTTALLGKAQYLVAKGLAQPHEVLIVSFSKDVAKENENKINHDRKSKFGVKTYHSLGLKLIRESVKDMPSLSKVAEDKIANSRTLFDLIKASARALI
jgi:hypothetical protein